jgi:hypothetical protein
MPAIRIGRQATALRRQVLQADSNSSFTLLEKGKYMAAHRVAPLCAPVPGVTQMLPGNCPLPALKPHVMRQTDLHIRHCGLGAHFHRRESGLHICRNEPGLSRIKTGD